MLIDIYWIIQSLTLIWKATIELSTAMKYSKFHEAAAKKVRSKKRFYRHLAFFISAMFMMISINLFTYNWHDGMWSVFPFVTWGSLILFQYLLVFGFPGNGALSEEWEIEQVKKEMHKLDNAGSLREEFTELSMEERLELNELDRLKSKWESDQFV